MTEDIFEGLLTCHGGYDDMEIDCLIAVDVTFSTDFGPWKAGEDVHEVTFNFDKGTAIQYAEGRPVRGCKFRLSVTEMLTGEGLNG